MLRRISKWSTRRKVVVGIVTGLIVLWVIAGVIGGRQSDRPVTVEPVEVAKVTAPTATPKVDLETTKQAALWVRLTDGRSSMDVHVDPSFDIDKFDLDLFIDGSEYCNTSRMYSDEGWYKMGCKTEHQSRRSVQRVSVQTQGQGDLRCERNVQSDSRSTYFACTWR